MPDQSGVEPLAAGQVQDAQSGGVADEFHHCEALDEGSPRLLFGSLVLLGDRVVIGCHDGLSPNRLRRGAIAIQSAATFHHVHVRFSGGTAARSSFQSRGSGSL
jgi:hypothetical protein